MEKLITWKRPQLDWVKMNFDGAVNHALGLAAAGGLLRDGDGQWIQGFVHNIGKCTVPRAELWRSFKDSIWHGIWGIGGLGWRWIPN